MAADCRVARLDPDTPTEWFEVVFSKVFVKRVPSKTAMSWGFVHRGQKVQVESALAVDSEGDLWVELTATELRRCCPDVLLGLRGGGAEARGFCLVDGAAIGLGRLLLGPLPVGMRPSPGEDGRETMKGEVTLRRLSGDCLSVRVDAGEAVEEVLQRAALMLGLPASRLRLAQDERVLEPEEEAQPFVDATLDLVALSAMPKALAGCEDGSLHLWDLDALERLGEMRGHRGVVWALAADFPRQRALSGASDSTLRLWDLQRLECVRVFEAHSGAVCGVSADFWRGRALSGADDGGLIFWDLEDRGSLWQTSAASAVWSVAADLPAMAAITGSDSGAVQLWDLRSSTCSGTLPFGHQGLVQVVSADFAAGLAVSGSDDGLLCIWDLRRLECLRRVEAPGRISPVWALGDEVHTPQTLVGSLNGGLELWDLEETACIRASTGPAAFCSLAANFGLQLAVAGSFSGEISFWDLTSMEKVGSAEGHAGVAVRAICVDFHGS